MSFDLTDEQVRAIEEALFTGRKIEAIKLYRKSTGQGLKESKDFIDALELDLRRESPEKFLRPNRKGGCAAVLALLFACGAAVMISALLRL